MKEKRAGDGSIKRLLGYLAPWKTPYAAGLFVTALDPYMKSLLVGLFIGGMLEFARAGSFAGVMKEAVKWLLLMAAWLLAAAAGQYAFESVGRRAAAELKEDLYQNMIRAPYRVISGQHTGDLLSRLDSDVQSCQGLWGRLSGDVVRTVLSVVLGFATVWSIHWLIAVVLCGVGVFMMVFNSFMTRINRKRYEQEAAQQGETISYMSDLLAGSQLVRIYGEDTGLMKRFEDSCRRLFRVFMCALNVRACYYGFNQVNAGLTLAGSLGLGMFLYHQGVLSLTALPLLISMGTMVVSPIAELGWIWDSWNEMVPKIHRVTELLDQEKEDMGRGKGSDVSFGQGAAIRAEHMSFFYEEGSPALFHVDLEIPVGSTYGIVGHSGSGKSTLLRLLMGMEDYQGSLQIGGREVRDMPLAGLRGQIAYVPQECPLFDGSILENIQLGRPAASKEEVLAAAKAADVDEFVSRMEHGYDTLVGENGVKLSGGQRQRIAIARAMLKDAPILLLDEVTAALDGAAEQRIQGSLSRLMQGRTTLIVAHRLSNVVDADRILVLDGGRVVQQGTHSQLLETDGLYARLYRLQMGVPR